MSTILRRRRSSRLELGPHKRHELLCGEICYQRDGSYSGYGDGIGLDLAKFISAQMRRDWANNRDELLEFWATGNYTTPETFPDSLPWLFVRGYPNRRPWAVRCLEQHPDPEPS